MKMELLRILRKTDGYVSGQQLCEHFRVSRTTVWKVIRQLREEGYEIEAVKNRGYHIRKIPDVLSAEEVESRLHSPHLGHPCIYLDSVDSTNNYAKKLGEDGAKDGTLVIAEEQTGGKGRRGKTWSSSREEQIAMTVLLRPRILPGHASRLTLLMAMAVARSIQKVAGLACGIKWPNDVVIGGKKVCGILTEMNTEIDYINYVVIGAGINVNQKSFPGELQNTACSLYQMSGRKTSRAELIVTVMEELEEIYRTFLKTEDLSALCQEYNELCINQGRQVQVLEAGREYTGTADGINDKGELVVRKDDGTVEYIYAGEVSVRGIYGYV